MNIKSTITERLFSRQKETIMLWFSGITSTILKY
jgi:hypothetical protein